MARTAGLAFALMVLAGSSAALAQNALGDGRGLERNSQVGSGGRNYQRPDFASEVRLRNALVTGNVGDLRSLRVDVGYTAPDEFRGSLGTDTLYRFRRDSIGSAVGYRGTDALRYTYSASTGSGALNSPYVTRLGATGYSAAARDPVTPRIITDIDRPGSGTPPRTDRGLGDVGVDQQVNTLRSVGAYTSTRALAPAVVGYQRGEQGLRVLTASPLLGLRTIEQRQEDLAERPVTPQVERPDLRAEGTERAVQEARTAYDDLRARLLTRPEQRDADGPERPAEGRPSDASQEERRREEQQRIEDLRRRLRGEPRPGETPDETGRGRGEGDRGTGARGEERRGPEGERRDGEGREGQEGEGREEGEAGRADALRTIRERGGRVDMYITGTPGELFGEHIRAGQDLLAKGRYFDAEARFASALGMRPGDTTALAGRLHAQVGAGLLLSAGMNLRDLLTNRPEVAGVRYGEKALPTPERLTQLKANLQAKVDKAVTSKEPLGADDPLVLAYLAFQTEDRATLARAVEVWKQATPNDPLIPLAEGVWIGEEGAE